MSSRHLKPVLFACSAIGGVVLALGVTGAGASLVWNGDFETANLSQYNATYCYQSYSCSVVAAPGRTGYAGRLETRYHDFNAYGSNGTVRAQLQINSNEKSGDESWWHWE